MKTITPHYMGGGFVEPHLVMDSFNPTSNTVIGAWFFAECLPHVDWLEERTLS
jgi:hypothetical protein